MKDSNAILKVLATEQYLQKNINTRDSSIEFMHGNLKDA